MPNADVLEFLFATVATIVATLTGLIGAFSTFRLQTISAEIGFLKGFILEKKDTDGKTLNEYIKGDDYHLLEKVYDRDMNGVLLLEEIIIRHNLHHQLKEFSIDVQNIRNNQRKYDAIKRLTLNSFMVSLLFVLINLVLLFLTLEVLKINHFFIASSVYFVITGAVLSQFIRQVKLLMD